MDSYTYVKFCNNNSKRWDGKAAEVPSKTVAKTGKTIQVALRRLKYTGHQRALSRAGKRLPICYPTNLGRNSVPFEKDVQS